MFPFRAACLSCLTVFLVTAQQGPARSQPAKPSGAAPTAEAAKKTPGDELLLRVLDKLDKVRWLETSFKQHMVTRGVKWDATGHYIVSPQERKVSYELKVRVADGKGSSRIVCDGTTIWRIQQTGDEKVVQSYALKDLLDARQGFDRGRMDEKQWQQLLRDDDAEHGFRGIEPVIRDLSERVTFPRMEATFLDGKPVFLLEGHWTKELVERVAPSKKPEGAQGPSAYEQYEKRTSYIRFPRTCKLYVGRENLWPYKLEWYGPTEVGGKDVLLSWLEFSEPVLEKPASADPAKIFDVPTEEKSVAQPVDPVAILKVRHQAMSRQAASAETPSTPTQLDPTLLQPLPGSRK